MSKMPHQLNYRAIVQWPGELTNYRQHSRFDSPWGKTLTLLTKEIENLDGDHIVFQIAVPETCIRLDGGIKASSRDPEHPGVIISFDSKHGPLSYFTDIFLEFQDNVRAIALALEALRAVDRYGVNKGAQYKGYKQLPAQGETGEGREHIKTKEQAAEFFTAHMPQVTKEQMVSSSWMFDAAYKHLAKLFHPDKGGDEDTWIDLQDAAAVLTEHFKSQE